MADRPWKQAEREAARLFFGARFWSNSGASIDFEGPTCVGQVKHVRTLSLHALAELAEQAERDGQVRNKAGVVCVKTRPGPGKKAVTLVVCTDRVWWYLNGRRGAGARGGRGMVKRKAKDAALVEQIAAECIDLVCLKPRGHRGRHSWEGR